MKFINDSNYMVLPGFRALPAVLLIILLVSGSAYVPDYQSFFEINRSAQNVQLSANESIDKAKVNAVKDFATLPMRFETNETRMNLDADFVSRGRHSSLALSATEMKLWLAKSNAQPAQEHTDGTMEEDQGSMLRMHLLDGEASAKAEGLEQLSAKSNYFIGNDSTKWKKDVANYGKVKYHGVYPGIDLVYYGNQGQLEYDFVVSPGADTETIHLAFEGAEDVRVDENGDLLIATSVGDVRQHKPFAYQEVHGMKSAVSAGFVVNDAQQVTFEVGEYDLKAPLVIDPVLVYSSFLGGSDPDAAETIAVDAAGNMYIAGTTSSTDFPAGGGVYSTPRGYVDGFITKFNPTGTAIIYSTYIGGYNFDRITAITVDNSGQLYATGWTNSSDFPTTPGAFQRDFKGGGEYYDSFFGGDGFIVKLNAAGNTFAYSTLVGGKFADASNAIAVDSQGNACIAGHTWSPNFPVTAGAFQTVSYTSEYYGPLADNQWVDGFITKMNATGTAPVFSTYIGGNSIEYVRDMKLDSAGNIVFVGSTNSNNYPTTPGAYSPTIGYFTSFITKLHSSGASLVSSTIIKGGGTALGVALDSANNVYITGYASGEFPTTPGAFQPVPFNNEYVDAIIAKFNSTLSQLIYATFIGGFSHDDGVKIEVDSNGNAYITGSCESNFPVTADAFQKEYAGARGDAFFTKINANGTQLLYSTYIGGPGDSKNFGEDLGRDLALDSKGNVYVAGYTFATTFPTTPGAYKTTKGPYENDGFFLKFEFSNFDICFQDDSNGNRLQFNSTTGDYQFTNCSGFTLGGTGTVKKRGSQLTLEHNTSDRKVMVSFDGNTNKATATLKILTSGNTFSITDRNILNSTCSCR